MKIIRGCVLPDTPKESKTYYFYIYKPQRDGCGDWASLGLAINPEQAERDAQAALVGFPRKLCAITIP